MRRFVICTAIMASGIMHESVSAKIPTAKQYTNSVGMKLVRIEPGTFEMGQLKTPLSSELLPYFRGRGKIDLLDVGDFDEKPVHKVIITKPFYIGIFEVTNFQYELFDHKHKIMRGTNGISTEDSDAAVNVNWYEAQAFCRWLSDQEAMPYRLATEAEWEYACRAGTTSHFHTGDTLDEEFVKGGNVSLAVGQTPPNAYGIYDMHGNVEEWCYDWYGPYKAEPQTDPVGYEVGDFRVLRGGSHSTESYYMRSANRMGQMAESRNWYMGFRVVIGELPKTKPLTCEIPLNQQNVIQRNPGSVKKGPDPGKPYFRGPYKYVKIPREAIGPLFAPHNHDPAIVECPNGDLITCWYTCVDEGARELAQAASRLPWGEVEWQPASPFWDAPDRNDHAPAMWFDGKKTIHHFTGVGACGGRGRMAVAMRTSTDSGATWSQPTAILPDFAGGHQLSEPVFRMKDGTIVLTVDGRRTLWMSRDEGLTWTNPGGDIVGIHAGVVQLDDGGIFAMSRDDGERGMMPISFSYDGGRTFMVKMSEFPPVGGGQRLFLLRLEGGQLFLASFAGSGIDITDASGNTRKVYGLYAALSEDDGKTWPYKRLISDDGPTRMIECTDGGAVAYSAYSSEYRGYLAGCQSTNGLIHVISSRNHFAFNLKWLKTRPPVPVAPPLRVKHMTETFDGPKDFDLPDWADYKGFMGGFNGKGQFTVDAKIHYNGLNRLVGSGSFEAIFEVRNIHYNPPGRNISEGLTMGFKDVFNKSMLISFKENRITGMRIKGIPLKKRPTSAKMKFIWNEGSRQWRIFYGLDGAEPTTEVAESKAGLYFEKPLGESTAAFFMMSNGKMDIDYFEITPKD